jgi:positive phototaxis protein PixI
MSDFANFSEPFAHPSELTGTFANKEFLRLRLTPQIPVLLPIQQLTEVLNVPENQIMPIPDLPAWVMGVYNWRGEILWMLDSAHLCGLDPWYQQPMSRSVHSAVVLNSSHSSDTSTTSARGLVGIVVRQIEEIEIFDPKWIQPSLPASLLPQFGDRLAPFTMGYWQKSDYEVLAILDAVSLLKAMTESHGN